MIGCIQIGICSVIDDMQYSQEQVWCGVELVNEVGVVIFGICESMYKVVEVVQ